MTQSIYTCAKDEHVIVNDEFIRIMNEVFDEMYSTNIFFHHCPTAKLRIVVHECRVKVYYPSKFDTLACVELVW